jgi:hypothetical protein
MEAMIECLLFKLFAAPQTKVGDMACILLSTSRGEVNGEAVALRIVQGASELPRRAQVLIQTNTE